MKKQFMICNWLVAIVQSPNSERRACQWGWTSSRVPTDLHHHRRHRVRTLLGLRIRIYEQEKLAFGGILIWSTNEHSSWYATPSHVPTWLIAPPSFPSFHSYSHFRTFSCLSHTLPIHPTLGQD